MPNIASPMTAPGNSPAPAGPPRGAPSAGGSGIPPGAMAMAGADQAAAQAADAQRQQLEQVMMQVRQLGEGIKAIATAIPQAADEANQIQQLLKAIVVKAAQGTPMQTSSGMAVPGGGGGA